MAADLNQIAGRLIEAYDTATTLPPITAGAPGFNVAEGYAVLAEIEARRRTQGWRSVGRKIGFTNRTIWPRYGVHQPMWAHIWSHTVHFAENGRKTLDLRPFVQPYGVPGGTHPRGLTDSEGQRPTGSCGEVQANRSGCPALTTMASALPSPVTSAK